MIIFNWAIHIIIGLFFSLEFAMQPMDILFIVIGSILPDIDHHRSMLGRLNIFVGFMSHRGFCHTLLGCAVLSIPFLCIKGAAPYVFLGGISHLFGDALQSIFGSKIFKIKGW
ncbi:MULTISPECIES: metal-dependent hydrolase [Pelosinus]|nr:MULTISPECIES: metal-dependent hydrolase [Pelosinus]